MSTTEPKLKPFAAALRERLAAMTVPSVIDLTDAPWRPSNTWILRQTRGTYSIRRWGRKFFVFRLE
jgi:hypothetical protein